MDSLTTELLAACEYGGAGFSENVLLHNAAECLRELARGHRNEKQLMQYVRDLHVKAEMEHAAVANCTKYSA